MADLKNLRMRRYMEAAMDPGLTSTFALALAIVFAASAATKFASIAEFTVALANYKLLPAAIVIPAAWIIPLLEACAALGFLFTATRTCAAATASALLVIFTAAIAINLARGRQIDCGCFGFGLRQTLNGWLVARNLVLIVTAGVVAIPMRRRDLGVLDMVSVVGGAISLSLVYLSMNYLLANIAWIGELERLDG